MAWWWASATGTLVAVFTVSRPARALLGYAVSVAAAACGLGIEVGAGWGLVAGGVVGAGSFLLLAETDEAPRR